MEVNNRNKSENMKKVEKQSNPSLFKQHFSLC